MNLDTKSIGTFELDHAPNFIYHFLDPSIGRGDTAIVSACRLFTLDGTVKYVVVGLDAFTSNGFESVIKSLMNYFDAFDKHELYSKSNHVLWIQPNQSICDANLFAELLKNRYSDRLVLWKDEHGKYQHPTRENKEGWIEAVSSCIRLKDILFASALISTDQERVKTDLYEQIQQYKEGVFDKKDDLAFSFVALIGRMGNILIINGAVSEIN